MPRSASSLASDRIEVDADPVALYERSLRDGWGDGLPLLPPTEERVLALIATTPYNHDDVICALAPRNGLATVEKAAVNAALAGVEPAAFPYVVAALEAIARPDFNLFALTTTTSSVMPMFVVNGPRRDELGFDYSHGCMGGAAGRGSSTVGRAVQLCLRNIGGQRVGETSKSVFGQPARSAGLCFGEWEERSPWPSLAEQRGHARTAEVISSHGGKGTFPMADVNNDDARDLLYLLAKCMAFPLANKFLEPSAANGEIVLVINPMWAERFGQAFPDIDDMRVFVHSHAWQPIDSWPAANQRILEQKNRVDPNGRVWVNEFPEQFVFVVSGGLGNLHAICLPSWGESRIQSQVVARP
ncbi:MAG TPA: hypothetical protein VGQ20_07555 [Acidimicrobiales bacterium]|nr:hypothetical protein [Acidimicrobiales bacterium]